MMTLRRVLHQIGGVLGRAELDRPRFGAAGRARDLAAEAAEDHRDERAVHALAHDVGQDRARRADQRAGDDQRRIAEREADARRRPAGIGIEHRDHDRHVGAADRDDDQDAERERGQRDQPECEIVLRLEEPDDQQHQRNRERDVDRVPARQHDRLAAHAAGEFQERDHRTREGDGADGDAERHFDQALAVDGVLGADVERGRRVQRAGCDQHRGHADQRMERRHQFRHRGHRYAPRDHGACAAADRDGDHHQHPGRQAGRRMRGERGRDRDQPCRSCRTDCPAGWCRDATARAAPE